MEKGQRKKKRITRAGFLLRWARFSRRREAERSFGLLGTDDCRSYVPANPPSSSQQSSSSVPALFIFFSLRFSSSSSSFSPWSSSFPYYSYYRHSFSSSSIRLIEEHALAFTGESRYVRWEGQNRVSLLRLRIEHRARFCNPMFQLRRKDIALQTHTRLSTLQNVQNKPWWENSTQLPLNINALEAEDTFSPTGFHFYAILLFLHSTFFITNGIAMIESAKMKFVWLRNRWATFHRFFKPLWRSLFCCSDYLMLF